MESQNWRDLPELAAGRCGQLRHPYILFIYIYMYIPSNLDLDIPVKRLQLNVVTGKLMSAPKKELFIKGPIPLEWLAKAAALPGKTVNVAMALWWHHGMAKGKPFKLTRMALMYFNIERDAAGLGLVRLEEAGLIQVGRNPGQRPTVTIVTRATKMPTLGADTENASRMAYRRT